MGQVGPARGLCGADLGQDVGLLGEGEEVGNVVAGGREAVHDMVGEGLRWAGGLVAHGCSS